MQPEELETNDGSFPEAVSQPEPEQQIEQPEPEQTVETQQPDLDVEESPQERNWREMRQRLDELKKQNEELNYKIAQREQQEEYNRQMQMWQQQQASSPKQEPEPDESWDEDDLITGAQAKKLAAQLARKEVEKYLKEQETQNIPHRLQQQYPDYNDVVNQETVAKFCKEDPETAADIEALKSDPLRMSRMLYKTIKARYGTNKQEEDAFTMAKKKQADERQKLPISSSAVPKRSALAEANAFANGLTPELKAQLLKEMEESQRYH